MECFMYDIGKFPDWTLIPLRQIKVDQKIVSDNNAMVNFCNNQLFFNKFHNIHIYVIVLLDEEIKGIVQLYIGEIETFYLDKPTIHQSVKLLNGNRFLIIFNNPYDNNETAKIKDEVDDIIYYGQDMRYVNCIMIHDNEITLCKPFTLHQKLYGRISK